MKPCLISWRSFLCIGPTRGSLLVKHYDTGSLNHCGTQNGLESRHCLDRHLLCPQMEHLPVMSEGEGCGGGCDSAVLFVFVKTFTNNFVVTKVYITCSSHKSHWFCKSTCFRCGHFVKCLVGTIQLFFTPSLL